MKERFFTRKFLLVSPLGAMALLMMCSIASAASRGEPVTIAERFTMQSKVLGEVRSYVVHKPWNYEISNETYPVLVLLDAENNINQVAAVADVLANTGRAMRMIVVGIENTDRQRDMTPPLLNDKPELVPAGAIGGAPKFLSFIADELLPHIDKTYRTRPTRMLVGFSYSGLFTLYALLNRPEAFKAYIAASPAMWWDDQSLAGVAEKFVAERKDVRAALYMTMANEGGPMLAGAHRFMSAIAVAPESIMATFQHWPHESHSSVNMPSVYEGLEWLHEIYYTHDVAKAYEESGLGYFDKKFAMISQYLGYEVRPPELVYMKVREYLVFTKRLPEARAVLEKQVSLYPESAGAHFDLASVCAELKDTKCGSEHIRRTVELFPGHPAAPAVASKLGLEFGRLVPSKDVPVGTLRKYAGAYDTPEGLLSFTVEGGKLHARLRSEKHEIRAKSDVDFYAVDADREYTFETNARGAATSVIVHFPERSIPSPRVAE